MSVLAAPTAAPRMRDDPSATLALALDDERGLLDELVRALVRQREAVAARDLARLEESSSGAHRILLNLAQARRRRLTMVQIMCGGEIGGSGLAALERTLGAAFTDDVRRACDALQRAAALLAEELRVNRGVLEGALTAGDQMIRALCGAHRESPSYHRGARGSSADSARLIDWEV